MDTNYIEDLRDVMTALDAVRKRLEMLVDLEGDDCVILDPFAEAFAEAALLHIAQARLQCDLADMHNAKALARGRC